MLSVDFDSELIIHKVVEEEISDAIDMMLMRVAKCWRRVLAFDNYCFILGFVHVESVFAKDITVVLDHVGNFLNCYFEVKCFIQEISWVICKLVFVQVFVAVLLTRYDIHMELATNLVVGSGDRKLSWIVHQVYQAFKHVEALAQEYWLHLHIEWICI